MSARACGDRVKYVIDKCRCADCRAAAAAYARDLNRRHARQQWGEPSPLVDAEPVRAHIRALSAQGMGWKRVAAAAGVANGTVYPILYGKGGSGPAEHRPPRRRVRRDIADRILAVRADLADGARVPAIGTQRRVQALATLGYSVTHVGERIGMQCANMHTLMRQEHVQLRTERAIAAVYDELWQTPAPPSAVANRARNTARKRGWAPPLAWDDDTIDDPNAAPNTGKTDASDWLEQFADDWEHTFDEHHGDIEGAALRFGVSRLAIEQRLSRARRAGIEIRTVLRDPRLSSLERAS